MSYFSPRTLKNPSPVVDLRYPVSGSSSAPMVAVVVLVLATAAALPSPVGASETQDYNVPSSAAIRGVFGFGVLLCATDGVPDAVVGAVRNGPCFDFTGQENDVFIVAATDGFWADTSVTAAIDVNGDGCVSESCNGQPNTADDLRVSNCGPVSGRLPVPDAGVARIVQIFLRGLDVTEDLQVCGATSGTAAFDTFH